MCYLIGLDIGTSSVKGVLMTDSGEIGKTAKKSFDYERLENGIVRIDADKFISACYSAIAELSEGKKISGICAASASGNLVVLDKDNKPITPIISWQDKRVTNEGTEILGEVDKDELYDLIGWPSSLKALPLAQLCYIKKHQPEILENCGMVCMSTEYLYYTLTGKWGISTSAGTPSCLINQKTGKYITEFLDKLGISENQLPPVLSQGTVLSRASDKAAGLCGLDKETSVVLGTFDHPSAARGAGVLKEGDMLFSLGTSWVAFLPVKSREKIVKSGALIDPFLSPEGCFGAMVSVSSVSVGIKKYLTRYIDKSSKAVEILNDLASKSVSGANGLTINPLNEPDDELIGKYPKEDVARAIMEGTVRLLKEKLERLEAFGISAKSAKVVGGPSEGFMWINILKEMLKIPIFAVQGSVTGAVGAAIMAGIGIGVYKNEWEALKIIKKD